MFTLHAAIAQRSAILTVTAGFGATQAEQIVALILRCDRADLSILPVGGITAAGDSSHRGIVPVE